MCFRSGEAGSRTRPSAIGVSSVAGTGITAWSELADTGRALPATTRRPRDRRSRPSNTRSRSHRSRSGRRK
jgi:hypothetical protein